MRYLTVLISLALLLVLAGPAAGQWVVSGIGVDNAELLNANGSCFDGATLKLEFRLTNLSGEELSVISHGFEFCGTDVTWDDIVVERNYAYNWDLSDGFPCFFDLGFFINYWGDGFGCDTVGIGAARGQFGTGLPADFDDIAWTVYIGPMHQDNMTLATITLDTCFYPPAGYWMWGVSGGLQIIPEWYGPYVYEGGCGGLPITWLEQDPIYLKDIADRVLRIYVSGENNSDVDLSSVRVNGKIPPYTAARIEGDLLVTDCFIFRFLSAWRPISSSVQSTYTIEYDVAGEHKILEGPVNISVPAGDLNLDGEVNQADLTFLAEHLFNGGPTSQLEEMMDVDQSGRVDAMDINALSDLIGQ